ncbi:hypothetical protein ACQUFY_08245 [Robbsia andropogonis]|uniref:hypothetical protein n=1 Tax=Robbsia andropogonis TaxID=28092 RepID=UPI003D217E00
MSAMPSNSTVNASQTSRAIVAAAVLVGIVIGALGTILGLGIPVLMERAAADAAAHRAVQRGDV